MHDHKSQSNEQRGVSKPTVYRPTEYINRGARSERSSVRNPNRRLRSSTISTHFVHNYTPPSFGMLHPAVLRLAFSFLVLCAAANYGHALHTNQCRSPTRSPYATRTHGASLLHRCLSTQHAALIGPIAQSCRAAERLFHSKRQCRPCSRCIHHEAHVPLLSICDRFSRDEALRRPNMEAMAEIAHSNSLATTLELLTERAQQCCLTAHR